LRVAVGDDLLLQLLFWVLIKVGFIAGTNESETDGEWIIQ